jgi:HK97 gp10 family phage protein
MAETGIIFEGLAEFEGSMVQLSIDLPEKVIRRGLRDGGRVVQAAVTEAAPVRPDLPSSTALPPGALKADIELRVRKENDGSFSAIIRPGKYTRYAAYLVEYGHKLVVGGKAGKGGTTEGQVPAHPFFRPAFDGSEAEAMSVTEATILAEIENEAARLGFKTGAASLLLKG